MKKLYTTLFTLCLGALTLTAQQLPNNGFETGWAKTTPYTGGASTQTNGESPADWTVAHVAGYKLGIFWTGKTVVGEKVTGYNSTYAAKVENVPNSVAKSQKVPGYITLGTSFNTANTSGDEKDGGTFGGISFSYRPDAITFHYMREQASGSTEQATVLAYAWKGTVKQGNVRVSIGLNPTKVTMENRDRNILEKETAYGDTSLKSADFEAIATIEHAITGAASDWTELTIPFEYKSSATPSMINVIFSAGDYFSTTPEEGNTLTIDDVKLLYYSRLATLSVSGTPVEGFDSNTYTYSVDTEMPEENAFSYTLLGNSGSAQASVALDKDNALATITVTNSNTDGTDVDGQTSHTYTIQFKKSEVNPGPGTEPEGKKYSGKLNIKLEALEIDVTQDDNVYIKDNGDGTCTFLLPNFTLTLPGSDPANFGDIKVDNVTMTKNADGSISYSGSVKGMSLAGGEIVADVELSGTETNGKLVMNIPVTWDGLTINVTFNGQSDSTAGIGGIDTDNSNAPVEWYNLNGVRVNGENLAPGIYIRRQGSEVSKVLVR